MKDFPDIFTGKSTASLQKLMEQLRITMNYILIQGQFDKQSNVPLSQFIEALKISTDGLDGYKLNEFRLENFIQLYEQVEERVQQNEIENTNKKYGESVSEHEKRQWATQLTERLRQMKLVEVALLKEDQFYDKLNELSCMIGRLCIRSLRNYNPGICKTPLFEHMTEDTVFMICRKFSDSFDVKDYEQLKREDSSGF